MIFDGRWSISPFAVFALGSLPFALGSFPFALSLSKGLAHGAGMARWLEITNDQTTNCLCLYSTSPFDRLVWFKHRI